MDNLFPTFESEVSFYVLYHAMRRIWHLFAPLPVENYFPVYYSGTAEEIILDLVGEKMLSNQLLTGQKVGGALVPEDAGYMLQVAVNRLLKGVRPKQVQGIFAAQNAMTALPLGSPTAESPMVSPALTLEEWLTLHPKVIRKQISRRGKPIPQAQIALLF